METTENKQFLYWVHILDSGDKEILWFIENIPNGLDDISDLDNYLSENIGKLKDTHDWNIVYNFGVETIGVDLVIPDNKPIIVPENIKPKRSYTKKTKSIVKNVPQIDYIEIAKNSKPSERNFYGEKIITEDSDEINKQIKSAVGNKKILFIENDNNFSYGIGDFYQWTLKNNVDSFSLFSSRTLPKEYVISKIIEYEVIAFQSTFTYEESRDLVNFVLSLKDKKTIIQIPIGNEQFFYYKPKDVVHDIYVLHTFSFDHKVNEWDLKFISER